MAFHQPSTVALPQESRRGNLSELERPAITPSAQQDLQRSEEWILFPTTARSSFTQTDLTESTIKTADLSNLSNIQSTDDATRSPSKLPATTSQAVEDDDLDVLDDSLHAFHDPASHYAALHVEHSQPVLPTHDGLGAFHHSGRPIQEYLRRFEGLGPSRRRSSVQRRLDLAELHDDSYQEHERNERIEKWRLEHSRVLLDEIERETRRRFSFSSHHTNRVNKRRIGDVVSARKLSAAGVDDQAAQQSSFPGETMWQRLKRRFIQSIVGVDDELLSVLFGETLPKPEANGELSSASATRSDQQRGALSRARWEQRLIHRLNHELNIFNPLIKKGLPPGAISPIPEETLENTYAGLPLHTAAKAPVLVGEQATPQHKDTPLANPPSPAFRPTLAPRSSDSTHAASWGVDDDIPSFTEEAARRDTEYWEGTLSISTIFQYMRNRFIASRAANRSEQQQQNTTTEQAPPATITTTTIASSTHRAALIHQLHPLIAIQSSSPRRRQFSTTITSSPTPSSILLHRQSSLVLLPQRPIQQSAATLSLSSSAYGNSLIRSKGSRSSCCGAVEKRRSGKKRGFLPSEPSSSRNYWDVGDDGVSGGGGWGEV